MSVDLRIASGGDEAVFPLIEMLDTRILDRHRDVRIEGIVGNNFSSYVRDYDFSVLLPELHASSSGGELPDDFGSLHGELFTRLVESDVYRERFSLPPVICISVSSSRTYSRTENRHPILGVEYRQDDPSLTDRYFAKMGLRVRYFMPRGSAAPLAFYFRGDLLSDHSNAALIGAISTMEAFQKIYRPEIYNANSAAGEVYRPSLDHGDYSATQISYDRVERSQLALTQGRFADEHLMRPYRTLLEQWAAARTRRPETAAGSRR